MKRFAGHLAVALAASLIGATDRADLALAQSDGNVEAVSLGQLFESETSAVLTPEGKSRLRQATTFNAGAGCQQPWFNVIVNSTNQALLGNWPNCAWLPSKISYPSAAI